MPPARDAMAPGVLIARALGRWGNWFNQELFCKPSTQPWALEIDPTNRPPGREAEVYTEQRLTVAGTVSAERSADPAAVRTESAGSTAPPADEAAAEPVAEPGRDPAE